MNGYEFDPRSPGNNIYESFCPLSSTESMVAANNEISFVLEISIEDLLDNLVLTARFPWGTIQTMRVPLVPTLL